MPQQRQAAVRRDGSTNLGRLVPPSPQLSWALSRSSSQAFPTVDALLASTAKLTGQSSGLERTCSKASSISHPAAAGSQEVIDKLTQHNERLERQSTAPGVPLLESRLSRPSWACVTDAVALDSHNGSPLIRAGRPQAFETGAGNISRGNAAIEAESAPASSGTTSVSKEGKGSSRDLQSQLKKLTSSIAALRDSISSQAPGRSRARTRIPVPAAAARMSEAEAPGSSSLAPTSIARRPGPVREEIEVSDLDDDEEPAMATHKQQDFQLREQESSLQQAANSDQLQSRPVDSAPAVSALFDSLWDTDDESSKGTPKKAAVRMRSGVHKKSAESGTLDRELKSLEQVWSSILDNEASSSVAASPSVLTPSKQRASAVKPARSIKGVHKESAEYGTLNRKMLGLEEAWKQMEQKQMEQKHTTASVVKGGQHSDMVKSDVAAAIDTQESNTAIIAKTAAEAIDLVSAVDNLHTKGAVAKLDHEYEPQLPSVTDASSAPAADKNATQGTAHESEQQGHEYAQNAESFLGDSQMQLEPGTRMAPEHAPADSTASMADLVHLPDAPARHAAQTEAPATTSEEAKLAVAASERSSGQQQSLSAAATLPVLSCLPAASTGTSPPASAGSLPAVAANGMGPTLLSSTSLMQQAPHPISVHGTSAGRLAASGQRQRIELPLPELQPKKGLRLRFWRSFKPRLEAEQQYAISQVRVQRAVSELPSRSSPRRLTASGSKDTSPERPTKSKDSFSKQIGSLFRRRSFSIAVGGPLVATPCQPVVHAASSSSPTRTAVAALPQPVRHETLRATSHQAEVTQPADIVPSRSSARLGKEDRGDSAQGWVTNEDAVKHLLVPTWVPSKLGVSAGPPSSGTEKPLGKIPSAAAAARASSKHQPEASHSNRHESAVQEAAPSDLKVNAEEWLSNEKAQKSLLLPTWVPSKLPLTAVPPLPHIPMPSEMDGGSKSAGEQPPGGWVSPESAVKNLLVPSWVPSKLPLTMPLEDFQPEGPTRLQPLQKGLIPAVSPRSPLLLPKIDCPDWTASRVPISDIPVPGNSINLSANRLLPRLPLTVPEDGSAEQTEADPMPCMPAPATEGRQQPGHAAPSWTHFIGLVSAATMPISQQGIRLVPALPVSSMASLPASQSTHGLAAAQSAQAGGADSNSAASMPKAKKDSFFKTLFRRKSESGERTKHKEAHEKGSSRRATESGAMGPIAIQRLPVAIAQPLPLRQQVPCQEQQSNGETSCLLAGDKRVPSLTLSGSSAGSQMPEQACHTSREDGPQSEFSFRVGPLTARAGSVVEPSRNPSTGRRRVTDEDLDSLQRSFRSLEQTYERLPPRTPSRERQRGISTGKVRQSKLPQKELFERAAGNVRPCPASAVGEAEAVPFFMRKLTPTDQDRQTSPDRVHVPHESEHAPASLTTLRWVESLRTPEPRKPVPRKPVGAQAARQPPKKSPDNTQTATQLPPLTSRDISPFGRVHCNPDRPVPFALGPIDAQDHLENAVVAESPTTQLEKQLKFSAGTKADEDGSPQWRMIAERVVKGKEIPAEPPTVQLEDIHPQPTCEQFAKDTSLERLFGEEGIATGTVDRMRSWTEQQRSDIQILPSPQKLRSGSSKSNPRVKSAVNTPKKEASPEPIVVDSMRPAFPALKAYLGAKSPRQTPQKTLDDDPELTACRSSVSILQRRFEGGLLLESNVAALQRHFEDQGHSRERTAAWAKVNAQKAAAMEKGAGKPVIDVRASSEDIPRLSQTFAARGW